MEKPNIKYRLLRRTLIILLRLFLNIKVKNRKSFDRSRNYVFMGNHKSWIDPLLVFAFMPKNYKLTIFGEEGIVFQKGFVAKLIKAIDIDVIFVDRANQKSRAVTLKIAAKAVAAGQSLLIMPEGRVNKTDGTLYPFYKGGFFVARWSSCPIVQIYMRGQEQLYFRRKVHMVFGEPIKVSKKDDLEEIVKKTYYYMKNELVPPLPKNSQKWKPINITELFFNGVPPAAGSFDEPIADGLKASELFKETNDFSRSKVKN